MGLDSVELVMEVEDAFAIEIPNAAAEAIQTIGDMTNYVTTRLAVEGRPLAREVVFERVCAITCEQVGVKRDQLTESTSFVNDLGMD
jgi:acyl carrier protein